MIFKIILAIFIFSSPVCAEELTTLKDDSGWHIFAPSSDSRIVYVSDTGSDTTCISYVPTDAAVGSDPFNPAGTIQPCATYTKAKTLIRASYPDWVLYRRGGVYYEGFDNAYPGRSASEPAVVAGYGTGSMPLFKIPQSGYAIYKNNYGLRYAAFSGLDFYSYQRDPGSPDYVNSSGNNGFTIKTGDYVTTGVLVEGCKFRFFPLNAEVQWLNYTGGVSNVVFYRSSFTDSWHDVAVHAQGVFVYRANVRFEECVFDHNGWYTQAGTGGIGPATLYNQNVYMETPINVEIKNCVSLRPSSIHFKSATYYTIPEDASGPIIHGNLAVDGEVGTSIWALQADPQHETGLQIYDNVYTNIGRSRPTARYLAYGIEIKNQKDAKVSNNLLINQELTSLTDGFQFQLVGYQRNVLLSGNVAYNWYGTPFMRYGVDGSNPYDASATITATDNIYQGYPSASGYVYSGTTASLGLWTFSGNKYFSQKTDGTRFYLDSSGVTDSAFNAIADNGWAMQNKGYISTTIEGYMTSIGETATIDAFISKCREQSRYNWDTRFTAQSVNSYLRAGLFSESQLNTLKQLIKSSGAMYIFQDGTNPAVQ